MQNNVGIVSLKKVIILEVEPGIINAYLLILIVCSLFFWLNTIFKVVIILKIKTIKCRLKVNAFVKEMYELVF